MYVVKNNKIFSQFDFLFFKINFPIKKLKIENLTKKEIKDEIVNYVFNEKIRNYFKPYQLYINAEFCFKIESTKCLNSTFLELNLKMALENEKFFSYERANERLLNLIDNFIVVKFEQ